MFWPAPIAASTCADKHCIYTPAPLMYGAVFLYSNILQRAYWAKEVFHSVPERLQGSARLKV